MLVSARLVYPPEEEETMTPKFRNITCPTITCRYFKCLDKSDSVHSSFLEKTWKGRIRCRISCLTDNVIYLITCLKCKSQYVGETKRCLRARMYSMITFDLLGLSVPVKQPHQSPNTLICVA